MDSKKYYLWKKLQIIIITAMCVRVKLTSWVRFWLLTAGSTADTTVDIRVVFAVLVTVLKKLGFRMSATLL